MQIKILICLIYGILFVRGTPFHPDSSIDLLKFNELQEKLESHLNNGSLTTFNSNETLVAAKPVETIHAIQESIVESTVTLENIPAVAEHNHSHGFGHGHGQGHGHGHDNTNESGAELHHGSSNMGPVELGLRNLVSASGIASEELFLEMATLSSETSNTINTKTEILMSHAMNQIFKSLSLAEAKIKKNQECGKQFVSSFNAILTQIDSDLKTCVHNLTVIGENYKNQSTQVLSAISAVVEEIQNLPDSCEIVQNFAVGTFCTVNNLAEINNRVVMNVKQMRMITAGVKEATSKAASSTVVCYKNWSDVVLGKLNNLVRVVGEKCDQQPTKPVPN